MTTKPRKTPTGNKPGRPKATEPASRVANIRMTEVQYGTYLDRGGARWVKRLIDEERQKGGV